MRYKYEAAENGVLNDAQAKVVGKELTRIERAEGCITPESVVTAAGDESSPMHEHFTWEDDEAARMYRLEEARRLIRSVKVTIINREAPPVRAFVSVSSSDGERRFSGRGYMSTRRALSSEEYRTQVLQTAHSELMSWKRRYEHLREFSEVLGAIEGVQIPAAA